MIAATRHVKRSATVTETFDAVTPRMLAGGSAGSENGHMVPVGGLAGSAEWPSLTRNEGGNAGRPSTSKASSSVVTMVGSLKTRQKDVGFQVLVGAAHKLHPSLDAGSVGAILAFACAAPTACYEIYAAWKEGDAELSRLKQDRIARSAQRVVGDLGVPGVKYGMAFNGSS